jgi:Tol biopolymer transport system component
MRSSSFAALVLSLVCAAGPARAQNRFTVDDMLKIKRVADPQVSPDGRFVAYVVTEVDQQANTRNNDIWIAPLSGGEAVRFLGSDKSENHPRWSPDGRQLAFVSDRGSDGSQVYLVAAPGDTLTAAGDPKKLTSLATGASGPIWSPDGASIAFVSQVFPDCATMDCNAQRLEEREQSKTKARLLEGLMFRHWVAWKDGLVSHLFLVPADGSAGPRDLTSGSAGDVPPFSLGGPLDYAFSPDSKEIAYVKKTDAVEATSTNSDLFIVPVSGAGDARKITPNSAADGGPAYSPDGRYLAYRAQSRAGAESDRWQLMVLDRKTGNARSLTRDLDRSPDEYIWTPDSQALLFVAGDNARSSLSRRARRKGCAPVRHRRLQP